MDGGECRGYIKLSTLISNILNIQNKYLSTALINHMVSVDSDSSSITAGNFYSYHPPVKRSEVSCRAAGGDSVIYFGWMLADAGFETEAFVWRMFSVTTWLTVPHKSQTEKKIKNSPTPPPESYGPGCPTLEQGFYVRQK